MVTWSLQVFLSYATIGAAQPMLKSLLLCVLLYRAYM
ncbi:uncharacterized protein DS421_10g297130 [Arachis hypogaea]|nr:uncharacterized protein DS421_10g297130 [Arachis hypogaea]